MHENKENLIKENLILILKESKIFLTNDKFFGFNEVNLQSYAQYVTESIYLEVAVLNHKIDEKRLLFIVEDIKIGEPQFPKNQIERGFILSKIEKIAFKDLSTKKLSIVISNLKKKHTNIITEIPEQVHSQSIKESIELSIKKLNFSNGYVWFNYLIKPAKNEFTIKIFNPNIIKEFESIKNYFQNKLNVKKIKIDIEAKIRNFKTVDVIAQSNEIDEIDETFVEYIKFEYLEKSIKSRSIDNEKVGLLTIDDFIPAFFDDRELATKFFDNENTLLNNLIEKTVSKHNHHLNYLAKKHDGSTVRLRFILRPLSFLFFVQTREKYYFIWETINTTEATYIWSFVKDKNQISNYYKSVENAFTTIISDGKVDYLKSKDQNFKRVYHDYSDENNGFMKWKSEIESILL